MPVEVVFSPPSLPLVEVTTVDTGETRLDEWGEIVPVYRVTSIFVNNQTPYRWAIEVFKDGQSVFGGNVNAGFSNNFTIQRNRQFLFHEYSAGIARQ